MQEKKLLEFSARAIFNMENIEAYIAADNPVAARKVVDAIMGSSKRLMTFPMLGREGRNSGTRELVLDCYPYVIVYRLTSTKVKVLTVLHQSRLYP